MKFNPYQHNVSDVLAYAQDHPEEISEILLEEMVGRNRGTVMQTLIVDLGLRYKEAQTNDFETRIRTYAERNPGRSVETALYALDNLEVAGEPDPYRRAEWVLEQSDIMNLCNQGMKINAIKEVRARTGMGLKEAKEAVEDAVALHDRGYLTKAQRRQLEVEEQAAIASILGA